MLFEVLVALLAPCNVVAAEAGSVVGSVDAASHPNPRTSLASGPEGIKAPGWVPEN